MNKGRGVGFGSWPALASFALVWERAVCSQEPQTGQWALEHWNSCTVTFSWQAASSALQSCLIRSSKPSSQCFSSLLSLRHSSQKILSGWERSTLRGLSPQCIHKECWTGPWPRLSEWSSWKSALLDRPGWSWGISPQARAAGLTEVVDLCWKAFVIGGDCPGVAGGVLEITLGPGSCVDAQTMQS